MKYSDLSNHTKFFNKTKFTLKLDGFEMWVPVLEPNHEMIILDHNEREEVLDCIQYTGYDNLLFIANENGDDLEIVWNLDDEFTIKIYKKELVVTL